MEDSAIEKGMLPTVLMVSTSEFLCRRFVSFGAPFLHILVAHTSGEAKRLLSEAQTPVSLVLVDGALLSELQEEMDDIPFLAVSEDREDEYQALSQGCQDFMQIPANPKLVLLKIERAIRLGEERRRLCHPLHDRLTGLFSQESLFLHAEQLRKEHPEVSYDVLECNIDHFRMFRDLYGKEVSDNVLRILASLLKSRLGKLGGIVGSRKLDSFLAIVPHQEDWPGLLRALLFPLRQMRDLPQVLVRSGIYPSIDRDMPVAVAFQRACFACDHARENYNKPYCFYDKHLHRTQMEEMQLVGDIPRAIEEKQFVIRYQPKYRICDRKLVGAEALVRWNHPQLGYLCPSRFIPLFERNGLISRLDSYIWNCVASQIRIWKETMGEAYVPISTNISQVDVGMQDLVGTICRIVEHYGLSPSDLHLEVTESAYTREPSGLVQMVGQLRALGYRIEMDDFGSGCSSLNMLALLPLDVLKLDMRFLQQELDRPAILRDVLSIAHDMHVPVIAEGVETEAQARMLENLGCEYAQGFFFGKPMTAEQFAVLMGGTEAASTTA